MEPRRGEAPARDGPRSKAIDWDHGAVELGKDSRMPWILNVAYVCLAVLASPWLVYKAICQGKYREGWSKKLLGKVPSRVTSAPCAWFHAVSVGEVLLLRPVVASFARRHPDWEIVISTSTSTGLDVARRTYPELVTFHAPLDFTWATRRAMNRIRPRLLVLVELELWPNMIRAAKEFGAKVAIINGRLSARSFRGYMWVHAWIQSTLRRLDLVAAQNLEYASRFITLGLPEISLKMTGSVKFDGLETNRANSRTLGLRRILGLKASEVVFVAGSTMEGEEEAALMAFRSARAEHPRLRLIVVPRHPHRFDAVASMLERAGEQVRRRSRSELAPLLESTSRPSEVILIDSLGELSAVWGLADVAFVGGSLFPGRGGQNMMEPAAYGASVLFGAYTSNFRDTVEQLLARKAARRVMNAEELTAALREDLVDPESAAARGNSARSFVLAQHGAADRTVVELERLIESSPSTPNLGSLGRPGKLSKQVQVSAS